MEGRKGDARVSIISALFFACILAGGIFLFLYMLLPLEQAKPWYPIAGLILVTVPWFFWILICIYRCFKPGGAESATQSNCAAIAQFPVNSPGSDQRHVQFAGVVVMGNGDGNVGQNQNRGGQEAAAAQYQTVDVADHRGSKDGSANGSEDSEMPLRLMS